MRSRTCCFNSFRLNNLLQDKQADQSVLHVSPSCFKAGSQVSYLYIRQNAVEAPLALPLIQGSTWSTVL